MLICHLTWLSMIFNEISLIGREGWTSLIKAWKKWLTFCWWHFQINYFGWKFVYLDLIFTCFLQLTIIDGLVHERCNSIANALELRLSCTNPSKSSGLGSSMVTNITYSNEHPVHSCIYASQSLSELTSWGQDKMAILSQTIFSNAFSWMEMYEVRLRFHWTCSKDFN